MPTPLQELTTIVREVLHDPRLDLQPQTRFEDLPGGDSMDIVSIVVEAECRFDVMFDAGEIGGLRTAGDLLRQIAAKQAMALA